MTNPTIVRTEPDTIPDLTRGDWDDDIPPTDRHVHVALICQLLTHAWWTAGPDTEPPAFLPDIAAAILTTSGPLPGAVTASEAHQRLDSAATTARSIATAAEQEAAQNEQRLADFHTDVRRRAAAAYNAKEICLEGTNSVLHRLGIAPLQLLYDVDLLVPVTVQVYADNHDDACDQAKDQLQNDLTAGCQPDFDLHSIRCDDARTDGDYIDPDDIA